MASDSVLDGALSPGDRTVQLMELQNNSCGLDELLVIRGSNDSRFGSINNYAMSGWLRSLEL